MHYKGMKWLKGSRSDIHRLCTLCIALLPGSPTIALYSVHRFVPWFSDYCSVHCALLCSLAQRCASCVVENLDYNYRIICCTRKRFLGSLMLQRSWRCSCKYLDKL